MTQFRHSPVVLPARDDFQHIEVTQVGGLIGGVVGGIRIGGNVEAAAIAELRAALLRHRVVFLRHQHHATDDQLAFAALLGEVTKPHPTVTGDGKAILPIDSEQGKANSWHRSASAATRASRGRVTRASTPRWPPDAAAIWLQGGPVMIVSSPRDWRRQWQAHR
jgi:alpha-ketoglutarate-dependent sulfate ester dioxygenase